MPSAKRCARRSVALVARQGLSRSQAAEIVMHLCDDVAGRLYQAQADPDLTWLAAIRAEARRLWLIERDTYAQQRPAGRTPKRPAP